MPKAKKTRKVVAKGKRNRRDYKLFLRMCDQGKSNEEIAQVVGIKVNLKSEDAFKPVRALKSLARTHGLLVDGELVKLRDGKKPKAKKVKVRKAAEKPLANAAVPAA